MKNFKIDAVKVISVAGTVLGLVGTLASNWTQKKTMDETIKKEVEKAVQSMNK